MSEENPICTITKLEYPDTMPVDGGLQVTLEYENTGAVGPTFYRARKPGTFDFKLMYDTENHVPGDLKSATGYIMVPEGHLIYQVEVGHGTWLNPIKITDTKMIIILHPEYPPPDPSDTTIRVDLVTPPKLWPVVQRFWAEAGSTIIGAWVYDNRAGEFPWTFKYQPGSSVDPSVVSLAYTVNGEPLGPASTVYTIGPGEAQVFEVTAKIPEDYTSKFVTFSLYPVNPTLVEPE